MLRYILKRIVMLVPVLLGATFIVFAVMNFSPGDPALNKLGVDATHEQVQELREEMGLDDPFLLRYVRFIGDLLRGDLGTSYKNNLSVMTLIMERMPNTFLLALSALLFAMIIGIPVGIISAKKQYSIFDNTAMAITLVGASAPHFWIGMVGVLVFAVKLGWLPASYTADATFKSMILPMVTLGLNSAAIIARMSRSAMLDVIHQDYIDTAYAKGDSEPAVTFQHQLRNALIPIATVIGLQFGQLLGGAVTTETIFAWPGIGRFIVESVTNKDIPCVLGAVVALAIVVTAVNLLVDVVYTLIDPRIKTQYIKKRGGGRLAKTTTES